MVYPYLLLLRRRMRLEDLLVLHLCFFVAQATVPTAPLRRLESKCPQGVGDCGVNGNCIEIREGATDYLCLCVDGFTGTLCDKPWDACTYAHGQLCLNNGVCTSETSEPWFSCQCPTGYKGTNCEIEDNICSNANPCLNDATCIFVNDDFICQCKKGFEGKYCQDETTVGIGGVGVYMQSGTLIFSWILVIILICLLLWCCYSVIIEMWDSRVKGRLKNLAKTD